jgi:4-diphosphocytidyl-2-C-methyl-D-erythritol kinase
MLHVVSRLDNGYHHLQTLVTFVGIGDCISIATKKKEDELHCTGPFSSWLKGNKVNSIILAKKWFYHHFNKPEQFFKIHLQKNLPVAAGIGGGTSDAAAMIRALLTRHDLDLSISQKQELVRASGILGADVPVSLAFQLGLGSLFWLEGTGMSELPLSMNREPSLNIVLVNPAIPVDTGVIFQNFTPSFPQIKPRPQMTSVSDIISFIQETQNSLEKPAQGLYNLPDIPSVISNLGVKTIVIRQSGSGATYFVLTETDSCAQTLAEKLRFLYPNWWIKATKTLKSLPSRLS